MATYYGKYRGSVLDNLDPMQLGRLLVQVPDVSNVIPTTWAMPCLPFCGIQSGFIALPAIGSAVWVEFEQGNSDYPIWSGCFWTNPADVPALAMAAPGIQQLLVQTTQQNTLLVSDVPGPTGGILLKTSAGAFLSITDTGIIINNGQGATVSMTGPAVSVNQGAMEVI